MQNKNYLGLESRQEYLDFLIAIVVILFTAGFILWNVLSNKEDKFSDPSLDITKVESLDLDGTTYYRLAESSNPSRKGSSGSTLSKGYAEVTPPLKLDTTTVPSKNTPHHRITIDHLESDSKPLDSLQFKTEEEPGVDSIITDTMAIPAKASQRETLPKTENIAAKKSSDCIILIGAFREPENINRLHHALKTDQEAIFQSPYRGLTRMGIYYPCEREKIQKKLDHIRSTYAKDAFILKAK